MRVEVSTGALEAGAARMGAAAGALHGAEAGDALRRIGSALPGGQTSSRARSCAATWDEETRTLVGSLRGHARALDTAGQAYRRTESAAVTTLGAVL